MYMDVDLQIYLQKLKDFFNTDKEAFRDMFGHGKIDMDRFYKMVANKATINIKKNGDPMLSSEEMLEIVTDLAVEDISKEIKVRDYIKQQQKIEELFVHYKDGYPPFCLN